MLRSNLSKELLKFSLNKVSMKERLVFIDPCSSIHINQRVLANDFGVCATLGSMNEKNIMTGMIKPKASSSTSDDTKSKTKYKKSTNNNPYSMANRPFRSSSVSSVSKKKSDLWETRERQTNIRYFYADPEIDKACMKRLKRLNPMTMMYMGFSNDNSHLLQSANYLRNELPIRIAHMIKDLRNLPFIMGCNPYMLEIHERCIKAFRNFDNFDREIKTIEVERRFNKIVCEMLEMNKDILVLLCDGFRDTRRYIESEDFIKHNLNKILSSRLGIRLLCEHHIELNKQSKIDLNEDDGSLLSNENTTASSSHTDSSSLHTDDWVGIINKSFSPKKLIETSARMVTRICIDKYGKSPKLKIDGHTNAQFPYIPLPLEYILPELLKNAFRATYEHHRYSASLPDVNVTIAINDRDCIIRIRDRGGGIPHELTSKIFDYHFTTANDGSSGANDPTFYDNKSSSSQATNIDYHQNTINNDFMEMPNEAVGMLCETSSRGLAVMHGYGFGLPTSKAYAEYLGGSLSFQSMQGIGSDFYLRLSLLDIEEEMVRI